MCFVSFDEDFSCRKVETFTCIYSSLPLHRANHILCSFVCFKKGNVSAHAVNVNETTSSATELNRKIRNIYLIKIATHNDKAVISHA